MARCEQAEQVSGFTSTYGELGRSWLYNVSRTRSAQGRAVVCPTPLFTMLIATAQLPLPAHAYA
eukprot:4683438-Pleurochrysis_carterae.AAC.1